MTESEKGTAPFLPWWKEGVRAIEAAEFLREGGFFNWACFCAHQAAELALKAALVKLGRTDIVEKHSLSELVRAIRRKHPGITAVRRELRALEWHYLKARYPQAKYGWRSPHDLYNRKDADVCIEYARRVLECCARVLSVE